MENLKPIKACVNLQVGSRAWSANSPGGPAGVEPALRVSPPALLTGFRLLSHHFNSVDLLGPYRVFEKKAHILPCPSVSCSLRGDLRKWKPRLQLLDESPRGRAAGHCAVSPPNREKRPCCLQPLSPGPVSCTELVLDAGVFLPHSLSCQGGTQALSCAERTEDLNGR